MIIIAVLLAALRPESIVPYRVITLGIARLPLTLTDVAGKQHGAASLGPGDCAYSAGCSVLIEHFGFDLLSQPWHMLFPFGDVGCVDPRRALDGKIDHHTISNGHGARSNVDYGTVAPDCRSKNPR
jgi:hypothetical protein